MKTEIFRKAFIKAAAEKGFSEKEALVVYNKEVNKFADDSYTPEDYMRIKQMLAQKGMNSEYNMDDTHPYGRQYNQALLKLRDQKFNANPEIEGLKSGVGNAVLGGAGGYGLGHIAGHLIKGFANPRIAKHLPGWGRAVGLGVGALGSGLSHYGQTKNQTEAVKKLINPNAMRQTFDQLSNERQYGNNQIGNYRML